MKATEKPIYIVTTSPDSMEEAGFTFVRKSENVTGDDFYIYFNNGYKSKISYSTKKDLFYTNKLFL
jgi:hypothetical protein